MSTPPKATPTTPQWAIEAAKAIEDDHRFGRMEPERIKDRAAIIAKHAPPPSDEALRAKILAGLDYCMDWKNKKPDAVKFACAMADARQYIIDLTALAPYLKGEPGDAELLDALDASGVWNAPTDSKSWEVTVKGAPGTESTLRLGVRAAIRAAMRGEGDKP